MEKKLLAPYPTNQNLSIVQNICQPHFQILLTISLKEFIKLSVNCHCIHKIKCKLSTTIESWRGLTSFKKVHSICNGMPKKLWQGRRLSIITLSQKTQNLDPPTTFKFLHHPYLTKTVNRVILQLHKLLL